jgi:hypothetical protein
MNFNPNPKQTEHDVSTEALLQAFEHFGRADEHLAREDQQSLKKLEQDGAHRPSDQQKRVVVLHHRSSPGRLAVLWLVGLAVAAGLALAAIGWRFYGDAAKLIVAPWAPDRVSSPLLVRHEPPAQASPPTVSVATEDAALSPPVAPAETTHEVPPKAAQMSPEVAQLLQTIARDIANLEQGIGQLKTSQEQMASENAKAIEQIKASQEQVARDNAKVGEQLKVSQEQMARDNAKVGEQLKVSQDQLARVLAKASEQNLRPKTSAPPPRQAATAMTSRPVPALRSPQARAHPQAPKPEQQ